jgi:peroxiredoxin
MRHLFILLIFIIGSEVSFAQKAKSDVQTFRAALQREDGNEIIFNFDLDRTKKQPVLYILNAAERLRVDSVRFFGDSVFIKMPLFESAFKAKIANGKWEGLWTKGTSRTDQVMKFVAEPGTSRFTSNDGAAKTNIDGRWAAKFASDASDTSTSIAEFWNHSNRLTGSFLTPTGDYRFLEGIVTGSKLKLSGFDGSHAFLFTADITSKNTIENGEFISGARFKDKWSAVKDPAAAVKIDESAMYLKPGEKQLNFKFPDLDSNLVSINDPRFKNKVVVIQLMGSWCPNCMDETAFLSEYYKNNKQRGVEMLGLAYEYSTDFKRSQSGLRKFEQRFKVDYPLLITGVTVSDTLRTEKTLPELTPIKVFPSSIIIDKKGNVRKLDNGFFGPGTGEHYEAYKREFNATMDELLKE